MNNYTEKHLRFQIIRLTRLIPFVIVVQKSAIISYNNKKFIPIIFKTRCDYYKILIKSLRLIIHMLKSNIGKNMLKQIKNQNLKMRIIITHSGHIIFQIRKKY